MAAHARVFEDVLHIEAGVWSLDGQESLRESQSIDLKSHKEIGAQSMFAAIAHCSEIGQSKMHLAQEAGAQVAQALLKKGAVRILSAAKQAVEKSRSEAN